jgi:hypothetical protein
MATALIAGVSPGTAAKAFALPTANADNNDLMLLFGSPAAVTAGMTLAGTNFAF